MFFFQRHLKEVQTTIKFRDEWGEMQNAEVGQSQHPRLSDSELAKQLETTVQTVITHRRD